MTKFVAIVNVETDYDISPAELQEYLEDCLEDFEGEISVGIVEG